MAKQYEQDTISEDDFKSGENLSQKQLVMALIKKINDENFKKSDNLTIETNQGLKILDSRETRISGINDLNTLLQPNFDKQMQEQKEKFNEELQKLENNFYEVSILLEADERVKTFRDLDLKKREHLNWYNWLKSIGYISKRKNTPEFEAYLDRKSDIFQTLFEQLIYLLSRCDWLRSGEESE